MISTSGVQRFRERQSALNRYRKEYYATDKEHEMIKSYLAAVRRIEKMNEEYLK